MAEAKDPLTTGQVAALFNVHAVTVGKWADEGKLPHFRTPGGRLRFRLADIQPFLEVTGVPS